MTRREIERLLTAADARVMTREQAQALIERAVKLSKADGIQVNVGGGYAANIRFADTRISTAGGVSTANLNIQSSFGPKHAFVTTNDFTDEYAHGLPHSSQRGNDSRRRRGTKKTRLA